MRRPIRAAAVLLGFAVFLAVGAISVPPAKAVNPDEILANPAQEARARGLSKRLRCLVCQNQSIDDSDAELARDLRILVRERITAGDTDAQVLSFLTRRYGDFVLLDPPVKPSTWLLWFGPFVLLAIGAAGVIIAGWRRRAAPVAPAPLTADERARLARIVDDDSEAGR
jgi:cytochrome c-type biogenesis protein CcmH